MSEIIAAVLVRLGAMLLTYATAQAAKRKTEAASEAVTQAKVDAVKVALSEALDGTPATTDQKKKLNDAFRDLVRGA